MTGSKRSTSPSLRFLMWALASAPAVWLLLFGLFVLRARVALGRWPAPYLPDPKELGFDLHLTAIVAGLPVMVTAVLCAIGLTMLRHSPPRERWLVRISGFVALAAVVILAQADPGQLFTWLGD